MRLGHLGFELHRHAGAGLVREGMHKLRPEGERAGRTVADQNRPTSRRGIAPRGEGNWLRAIVEQLNAEGMATPTGKCWYASTVRAMLTSETAKTL